METCHFIKLCVLVVLLFTRNVIGHRSKALNKIQSKQQENNSGEIPEDHEFFLKQIFDKYGHQGIISFEGFEHLLENLGLGRLVFEKSHALSLHKVNGSFQEVHDSLNLHHHSHDATPEPNTRRKRGLDDSDDSNLKITAYAEPKPMPGAWSSHCLTPQDLLQTFGLEPHHKAVISQRIFLEICPAIIYELDQRSCYADADDHKVTPKQEEQTVSLYSVWLYASLSVLVISLIGLLGVAMVPLVQRTFFQQLLHFLVALAVGTMCGDALLHLLPHALVTHSSNAEHDHLVPVLRASIAFIAIVIFFMLEVLLHNISHKSTKGSTGDLTTQTVTKERKPLNDMEDFETGIEANTQVRQQHSHQHGSHQHESMNGDSVGSVAWMVIMGDGLHNLTDGLAIGAAFSGDIVAGFATAVAVLCHELPHELGDFAVLLQAGMSIKNAIIYNIISSVLSFIGMAIGVWLGEYEAASLWIYAFTAGSFLYISLVDLIPEMNNYTKSSGGFFDILLQMGGIITGASIMLIIALYEDDLSTLFS